MSDPEIITLCISCGLVEMDSENAWYSFAKHNYRHLFPDSTTVPISTGPRELLYRWRNCSSRNWSILFRYQPAIILWLTAFPFRSVNLSVPATVVLSVKAGQITESAFLKKRLISALGSIPWFWDNMRRKRICLMSVNPSSYKTNWPTEMQRLIFRLRQRVETVFSQFGRQLNTKILAKSFQGIYTQLENKVLGTVCTWHSMVYSDPPATLAKSNS